MNDLIRRGLMRWGVAAGMTLLPLLADSDPVTAPPGGWKLPKVSLKLWNDPSNILPGEPLIVEITLTNDTDEDNVGLSAFWKEMLLLQFKKVTKWQDALPSGILPLRAPAPPIKIPPHQSLVLRQMVRTWDYNYYWLKKPIFTPGEWRIRFCVYTANGHVLTNEFDIIVTFKTGEWQDTEVFEYMFGGPKKHHWFLVPEKPKPLVEEGKRIMVDFVNKFPYSRCSRYARLRYIVGTQTATDPETVRQRNEYIKYLRKRHSFLKPVFPPWLAKYYLSPNDPRLKEAAPAK